MRCSPVSSPLSWNDHSMRSMWPCFRFAFSAVHGVHPRMTQAHRDVLQGPTFASRVQRDRHRCSGA